MPLTQYLTATSLDGFIADPEGSLDWLFRVPQGEDADTRWQAFLGGVGSMVMGATTYTWLLSHEDLVAHPEKWQQSHGDRPCWVFTHRELPVVVGADVTFVSGDVRPVHRSALEAAQGRNVWVVGGGDLAGAFLDAGLLDEVRAQVAPVTLGGGAPLLPRRSERLRLRRVEQNGQFAELTYEVLLASGPDFR